MAEHRTGRAAERRVVGRVFEIQRFSIHDGPGIRTTVFLKGCPLRCEWCHNPEGRSPDREISFLPEKCIGCGSCVRACATSAHRIDDDGHAYDRLACVRCGSCASECWAGAIETVGREVTAGEVIDEVSADGSFYAASGGGVTLSGGEPLAQVDFSVAILSLATRAGIHTCVETCGYASVHSLERLLPLTDLFLYDLKETDPVRHQELTGVPLEPILANLTVLCDAGAVVRIRLPIVPGLNDRPDHFRAVARLLRSLSGVEAVEVMPYHSLGTDKPRRFGYAAPRGLPERSVGPELTQRWVTTLRDLGVPVPGSTAT